MHLQGALDRRLQHESGAMPKFGVTSEKERELERRMAACGLREEDFKERFIRSGGPGGQKVNRTATCVYLSHGPTGLEVKMQKERSQALNRFFARRRLCQLLEERDPNLVSPENKKRDRARKQKSRRKRRSQKKYGGEDSGGESTAD